MVKYEVKWLHKKINANEKKTNKKKMWIKIKIWGGLLFILIVILSWIF
jgi:hypothetical protein